MTCSGCPAFTRALTILYSLTILSLFTHIQLNLLGIQKYIQSVKQLGHKEDEEEQVTEKTERKFLTLGWWILNVGWKDVAERVRSAVEVVFSEYVSRFLLGVNLRSYMHLLPECLSKPNLGYLMSRNSSPMFASMWNIRIRHRQKQSGMSFKFA